MGYDDFQIECTQQKDRVYAAEDMKRLPDTGRL